MKALRRNGWMSEPVIEDVAQTGPGPRQILATHCRAIVRSLALLVRG